MIKIRKLKLGTVLLVVALPAVTAHLFDKLSVVVMIVV